MKHRSQLRIIAFICLFPVLLLPTISGAQQMNNWYFGRKTGLDFNITGSQPVPAILSNSNMMANEAAASISDATGKLLFYTDGVTVFNAAHDTMVNGDNIGGNLSSSQVAIVLLPGQDSIYYIFTTDAIENSFRNGYRYSIVNMKKDNGRGEVISKNTMLWSSCTERLAAVRHANGTDVWIITNDFNSNVFRAWLFTCNGIQPGPVVSTLGQVLDGDLAFNVGLIKVSPDGTKLCQTHFPLFDVMPLVPNFVQLFDFNSTSGAITNARTIGFPGTQYTHCSFSPDSKLLYVSRYSQYFLDQFEADLPTTAAILASRISLPINKYFYDMQFGPDEKIYISYPGKELSVINNPNVKGAGCNLRQGQVNLGDGSAFIGLPSMINDEISSSNVNNFTYAILDSCAGRVQFSGFASLPGVLTWNWDFGDGQTSTLQNPVHTFAATNRAYVVRLVVSSAASCGILQRSRIVIPSGILSKAEFSFEMKCDSAFIQFTNKSSDLVSLNNTFTWDFGDGNTSNELHPKHTYAVPDIYTVRLTLTTSPACLNDFITHDVDSRNAAINVTADQTILVGQTIQLSATAPGAVTYQWSPATGLNNPQLQRPMATPLEDIVYKVKATDAAGCSNEDSVRITVQQFEDIYIPSGFTPNNDGKNDDIKPFFPGKYKLSEFSIFTRWGQRVFTTATRGKGWDGKVNGTLQNAGVYVWLVRLDEKGKTVVRKGTLTLIR